MSSITKNIRQIANNLTRRISPAVLSSAVVLLLPLAAGVVTKLATGSTEAALAVVGAGVVFEGAAAVGLANGFVKTMKEINDHRGGMDVGYPVTAGYPQISVGKNKHAPAF